MQFSSKQAAIGIVSLAFIVFLAGCSPTASESTSDTSTPVNTAASSAPAQQQTQEAGMPQTSEMVSESEYKDGEYSVTGTYQTPAGQESLGVTLTLENGKVTAAEIEQLAKAPISKKLQTDFTANFSSEVIGKDISSLKLGKISGSSLTPNGFNDAVEQIKTEASV